MIMPESRAFDDMLRGTAKGDERGTSPTRSYDFMDYESYDAMVTAEQEDLVAEEEDDGA